MASPMQPTPMMGLFDPSRLGALTLALLGATAVSACASGDDPAKGEPDPEQETTPSQPAPAPTLPSTPGSSNTPAPEAPPLGAEVGKWTWLDVPGAMCANGAPTGVGVNLGTGSELLVFFEGGGACWDESSCFSLGTASYVKDQSGYKKETFEKALASDLKGTLEKGALSRTAANNPFRTASMIYVPYCTGDVHSGNAEATFGGKKVHFVGRRNVDLLLDRVVPTFKNLTRVTVAGRSAGGFGAAFNYWRIQDRFRDVRVDLIDDSGPPFLQSNIPLFPAWKQAWDLGPALPPGCEPCKTDVGAVTAYYAKTYPKGRFALLSYDQDPTISAFFLTLPSFFAVGLSILTGSIIKPLSNFRYFVPSGSKHTMLDDLTVKSRDVELGAWLTRMGADARDWQNVTVQF